MKAALKKLDTFFSRGKRYSEKKYRAELRDFRRLSPETFRRMGADDFLEEYAWVVYAAGFKEAILEKKFPAIKKAFNGFKVQYVSKMSNLHAVLKVFNSERKARNVIEGSRMIARGWFANLKQCKPKRAVNVLDELPGIGPVNKYQLARDIGLADVAKPDIWIIRVTKVFGFSHYKKMVKYLSGKTGEKEGVVDFILWIFCAEHFKGIDSLRSYAKAM
jgi:3-methyladenine DNA glycosylase/8-oxoguanine DNA glycosylase